MKHLVWVILVVMVVLGAVVTGCEGTRRYDSRLMAADSLMRDNPDSALALVQAVCRDSLSGEGDRAYRDLLLTQARYKAYVTATSDSDINRALAWFRAHPSDREKLTRAYIYKGAVMEELGHPDSAMLYYKTAEAIAEEKDYANLGQINLRIAALYRIFFADEETCLDKYRKALRYFELTNNLKQEQICLYNIGVCLSRSDPNECKIHLAKACEIATAIDDSSRIYRCKEFLCRQLASDSASLQEAKLLAFDCLNNFAKFADNNLFFDLASIYAIQDNPDSARYYLRITEENVVNQTAQDKVRYYLTLEVLARNRGDSALCNYYSRLKHHISDSIDNNDNIKRIQQIENQGNLEQYNEKNEVINGLHILVYCLLIAGVLCLSASVTFYLIRRRQARAIIREMNNAHVNNHEQLLLS